MSNPQTTKILDTILNDSEKLAIQMFYDNELQREAVRKVILAGVYYNGVIKEGEPAVDPMINFMLAITNRVDFTDEQVGKQARVAANAVSILDEAFNQMARYKKREESNFSDKNVAR